MKYFLDTEFIEDGRTIELLSIGIVAEDGREFYQCNRDASLDNASDWIVWNVYPHLGVRKRHGSSTWIWRESKRQRDSDLRWEPGADVVPHSEIRNRLRSFVGEDAKPEFWSYYADYDWVAFCQLFGRMIDLPKGWPMYCRDVKQLCDDLGNPDLPKQTTPEHHALNDAIWTKEAYDYLQSLREKQA